ncbi:flavodoxin family protein [Asticcacaulis biprosthecium C19]|uniref:NADPH--hemoprotein reductase n=1 Tax=Asticcacaulis biprosthecium C19 TaxID=715226 RepID=F4QN53_9CAUL|nr:NADPH cytochrome P450 oxidoreductase family protein [Asticcacaulis biprosthecium]EGF91644.1 flavodoxin family protein [Asticcacaulis biprosthecium C19]
MTELMTQDTERWLWAWGAMAFFVLTCLWSLWPRTKIAGSADYLVLFASQTGQAEEIARHSHAQLVAGGRDAVVVSLRDAGADRLSAAKVILVVASTTGDGDAPDEGVGFERGLLCKTLDLANRRFAVLALGDRKYDRFCAFGRRIFDWLEANKAHALVPCIEVDDLDAVALKQWDDLLHGLGAGDAADEAVFAPWRLASRGRLNPQGEQPLYRLRLTADVLPNWQAGDLAEILTADGHRRDYSLASLPDEGHVELYVRSVEGGPGSTLLTQTLTVGDTVPLRIKAHRNFHAPEGDGPVLMVAAGSGLAGLRAHIRQTKTPGWLVYGERHPVRDGALCTEAKSLPLKRLDLAYSQPDDGDGQYVQDLLAAHGAEVRDWLGGNGALLVCGGLAMGQGVDAALRAILGDAWIEAALAAGRYRRDLY